MINIAPFNAKSNLINVKSNDLSILFYTLWLVKNSTFSIILIADQRKGQSSDPETRGAKCPFPIFLFWFGFLLRNIIRMRKRVFFGLFVLRMNCNIYRNVLIRLSQMVFVFLSPVSLSFPPFWQQFQRWSMTIWLDNLKCMITNKSRSDQHVPSTSFHFR